ncbi:MAG: hypothetical protein RRZ84_05735 [Romboutsia sp.]
MIEENILKLIAKFEQTLDNTEKLTNTMINLEGTLSNLDNSIIEIYELTKAEDITTKSDELLNSLSNLKRVQKDINDEYNNLVTLNLYKENLKEEIEDLKEIVANLDENLNRKLDIGIIEIKEEIQKILELKKEDKE